MGNAIKHLKKEISGLPSTKKEEEVSPTLRGLAVKKLAVGGLAEGGQLHGVQGVTRPITRVLVAPRHCQSLRVRVAVKSVSAAGENGLRRKGLGAQRVHTGTPEGLGWEVVEPTEMCRPLETCHRSGGWTAASFLPALNQR